MQNFDEFSKIQKSVESWLNLLHWFSNLEILMPLINLLFKHERYRLRNVNTHIYTYTSAVNEPPKRVKGIGIVLICPKEIQ